MGVPKAATTDRQRRAFAGIEVSDMQLEHEFTVPVPVEEAWPVLLDVQRIAPCLPGATIDRVEDDEVAGQVKVKVGPITANYHGSARFVEKDEAAHRFVLEGSGREGRGSGTARALITTQMHEHGSSTRVTLNTDLTITGRAAQFGRGVMDDVAGQLIGQFATCLAGMLGSAEALTRPAPTAAEPTGPPDGRATDTAKAPRPAAQAVDLFGTAGVPVLKRLAPVAAGAMLLAIGWLLVRARHPRVMVMVVPVSDRATLSKAVSGQAI
jgi:uncharacterized protein